MPSKSIILSLFFIGLFHFAVSSTSSKQIDCFLEKIYNEVNLSSEAKEFLNEYVKEENAFENRKIEDIGLINIFNHNDIQIPFKIEKILMNYNRLPSSLKIAADICFTHTQKALKACQRQFSESGCHSFNRFVAVKVCEKEFESHDWVHCTSKCPKSLEVDDLDPFVCKKKTSISFQEENQQINTDVIVLRTCSEGFTLIGDVLCVSQCPLGWIDLGISCEKPIVKRKDFEIFHYRFDVNEELE